MLKVFTGSGIGQIIAFAVSPVIARMYGPEAFGEQSLLLSIASLISIAASFSFPMALVLARDDKEEYALSFLALLGTAALSLIICLLLSVNEAWILRALKLPMLSSYIPLLPILAVLLTLNQSAIYSLSRHRSFTAVSASSVISVFLNSLLKLALGLFAPSSLALIVGNSVGYLVAPIAAFRQSCVWHRGKTLFTIDYLRETFWYYRGFAFLQTPKNLVNTLSQSLPIIALMSAHGAEVSGQYVLALAIVFAPVSLIGSSLQSVFYPRVAELLRNGQDISDLLKKVTLVLVMIGAVPFLAVFFRGEEIFTVLFSKIWSDAGSFAILLVPMVWTGLASLPAISSIPSLGLQREFLYFELCNTGLKSACIMWGVFQAESAFAMISVYAITASLTNTYLICWIIKYSSKPVRDI